MFWNFAARWPRAWATWTGRVQEKLRWPQTFAATQGESQLWFQAQVNFSGIPNFGFKLKSTFQEFPGRQRARSSFVSQLQLLPSSAHRQRASGERAEVSRPHLILNYV